MAKIINEILGLLNITSMGYYHFIQTYKSIYFHQKNEKTMRKYYHILEFVT